jgi:hypothetical protein
MLNIIVLIFSLAALAQTQPPTTPENTAPTPPPVAAPVVAPTGQIAQPEIVQVNPDEKFVEKLWGKEFGQCFMSQQQYDEFEKKWTRYRILTRARYNILAKSYFANKIPKQNPIEIDKGFQYQALEPMTCPGMTDEDRIKGVQKALEASLAEEKLKVTDVKKFFDWDENPKKIEDYLDLFNDPAFISMPYSLQDGYDQLYRAQWNRANSRNVDYVYKEGEETKTIKLSKDDLRAIDALARTMWAELSSCEKSEGHFQMLARVTADRAAACEKDPLVNRRHCRADPQGKKTPIFEQVISAPAQFVSWVPSTYGMINVTNTSGTKIGKTYKDDVGFRKLVFPNQNIRKILCPAMDETAGATSSDLRKAYTVALEFYRNPNKFKEHWAWPKTVRNGIRYYSYGVSFESGSPKNIHSIIDSFEKPSKEFNFQKTASASCPIPYLYEKR